MVQIPLSLCAHPHKGVILLALVFREFHVTDLILNINQLKKRFRGAWLTTAPSSSGSLVLMHVGARIVLSVTMRETCMQCTPSAHGIWGYCMDVVFFFVFAITYLLWQRMLAHVFFSDWSAPF